MPRYAAVDIGSNSVRMMVAEAPVPEGLKVLAQERQVTRLGQHVFESGEISQQASDAVCAQLARMAAIIRDWNVKEIRAVATSAVRDARNQAAFLARARVALGAPVEVISGQEEARLIHLGVQIRWPHDRARLLILDVGGGSAEFILSDRGVCTETFSRPLGAIRLTTQFLTSDPPPKLQLHQLREYICEKIEDPREHIAGPFDRVIGTSATAAAIVSAVNQVARKDRDAADRMEASADQVRDLFQRLSTMSLMQRRLVTGIGPQRAEVIVAGAAVFAETLDAFHQPAVAYSVAGVRDGIIADLAQRDTETTPSRLERDQRRILEGMAHRYCVNVAHVAKVAQLAGQLFDSLTPLHKLPPHYGRLLEAAGYLHDIGHFVSNTGHHKHSWYLVDNSDMPGFTREERQIIALLSRYHRRTPPGAKHEFFRAHVPTSARRPVILLTPLLRLADSLDRGHEQRVERMRVESRNGHIWIGLESSRDLDLELWAAGRIAELFQTTYDRPLVVEQSGS